MGAHCGFESHCLYLAAIPTIYFNTLSLFLMLKYVETLQPRSYLSASSFCILGNLFTHHNDTNYGNINSTYFVWPWALICSIKKYISWCM